MQKRSREVSITLYRRQNYRMSGVNIGNSKRYKKEDGEVQSDKGHDPVTS